MIKSKLMLNPDYYSAHAYMVEETEEDKVLLPIKAIIKSLMIIVMIGVLALVYNFYIKNNFTKISTWFVNTKELLFPETKEVLIIREETSISEKTKKIVPVIKIKKDVPIKEVLKVDTFSSSKNNELSDEYIKLMKKSLGNY